MNSYSHLQKLLHRVALSSQFMRQTMFDVEQSLFLNQAKTSAGEHVFVAGLARSGTTVLLNAISQSDQFASLSYDDMPFILAPNLWARVRPTRKHTAATERAHGDGIKVSTDSPEAFEEVFWKTFGVSQADNEKDFANFVALVLKKNGKDRYLSKNNQNIRRLAKINRYFPQSKILIPFRDPLQQAASLQTQHVKFCEEQRADDFILSYMNWIGHSEFGLGYKTISTGALKYESALELNHWLEQWYLTYQSASELASKGQQLQLISYEALCRDESVWTKLKDHLDLEDNLEFSFVEVSRNIEAAFSQELHRKCIELFETLKRQSFGSH